MDDGIIMEMLKSFYGLSDIVSCLSLIEELFLSQQIKQRHLSKLKNQIETVVLFVEFIKF